MTAVSSHPRVQEHLRLWGLPFYQLGSCCQTQQDCALLTLHPSPCAPASALWKVPGALPTAKSPWEWEGLQGPAGGCQEGEALTLRGRGSPAWGAGGITQGLCARGCCGGAAGTGVHGVVRCGAVVLATQWAVLPGRSSCLTSRRGQAGFVVARRLPSAAGI